MIRPKPQVIKDLLAPEDFNTLKSYLYNAPKLEENFDISFGRYAFNDSLLNEYLDKLIPIARKTFNSETLLPSYALFAHYEGEHASLFTHVDNNACTYTLDMCIYQTEPWDLNVDGDPYTLHENEALAYYGNDQLHGRDDFPNPASQHVAMIFFHFVEPDHWWYTKGQDYVNVIRGQISEEQWELQQIKNKQGKQGVLVVENFFSKDYSWDNFINSISDAYDLNDPNNKIEPSKEVVGKVNFFQKLTMTLDNVNEQNFPGLNDKINKLTQLHETIKPSTKCVGYFGAVSLTDKEPTTGKHSDPIDVIYSQFIGSVTWTIYDEDGSESFFINPGDIIYVPKNVMHEVKSLCPRAALSFMFEA